MALVSKILEATLIAGNTSVTFTDSDIPNSLIRVFSSDSNIIPESRILSGNTLTVVYAPQSNNIDVALEIVKQGLDIVDNVLSEDTDKALSAKQGYLLSAAIGDISDELDTLTDTVNNLNIPDNITDLDDVEVTDIETDQVLAWDGTKFVNVNQSGGGSSEIIFSTSEQIIGKWIDERNVYQKTIVFGALPNNATKNVPHGIDNLEYVVAYFGTAYNSTNKYSLSLPYLHASNANNYVEIYFNDTNVSVATKTDRTPYNICYITMQYIKSV